jgi:preprotein translocase subunit SecE
MVVMNKEKVLRDTLMGKALNFFLWVIFFGLIGLGLYLYDYYSDVSGPIKILFALFLLFLLLVVAFFTEKGRIGYNFMLDAIAESRKIVYPGMAEVKQVTLVVSGVVLLMSILLWLMDAFFEIAVSYVTAV